MPKAEIFDPALIQLRGNKYVHGTFDAMDRTRQHANFQRIMFGIFCFFSIFLRQAISNSCIYSFLIKIFFAKHKKIQAFTFLLHQPFLFLHGSKGMYDEQHSVEEVNYKGSVRNHRREGKKRRNQGNIFSNFVLDVK